MILQNILWPSVDVCMQEEMYFRRRAGAVRQGQEILFIKGSSVSTDTYFNGVSVDKWKKYTNIGRISLCVHLQGSFCIRLIYKQKMHKKIYEKIVMETYVNNIQLSDVTLEFPEGDGMAFFYIEALENDGVFSGGYYTANVEATCVKDVKLAIGICTFRRERYIEHNLKILRKYMLENPMSELYGYLDVFVSDNGKTLDVTKLESEHIRVVKNKNAGGAAGFARDMIETIEANINGAGITHLLLMDDDVILEPESILKTYRILKILKDEYKDAFIGGAMLRSDDRNIQVEAGAAWHAGRQLPLKRNLDMVSCDACLYNETEEYAEYNAWWYCCMPISVVTEKNLPMPVFIRGDDVEYGLRIMKHLILMNGICVWHEPFENKYSSALSYYILRNMFIDNALHCPNYGKKQAIADVWSRVVREVLYYRYKNAALLIRGVKDFLAGIDWLKKTDGEKLHGEILAAGYKAKPVGMLSIPFSYPVYEISLIENDWGIKRLIRLASGNGYLLPAKRDNVASMSGIRPYNAFRVKKILNYDHASGKGFVTERNRKEALRCMFELVKLVCEMNRRYENVAKEYRNRCKEVQNIEFWKNYLK